MAGRGPAPKDPAARARRNAVQRGEWLELPAQGEAPPGMPASAGEAGWLQATADAWVAWWSDPAATQWGPAQQNAVLELLVLTDQFWRGKTGVANEMRLRQDALGLTEKGKRDLRWRVPAVSEGENDDGNPDVDPYAGLAEAARGPGVASD